ncbi:hypothetical protein C5D18_07495 [Rathayibacter tritici]|nr:hypothetical protein C5D18_07495 [Rathayibacter tritici]
MIGCTAVQAGALHCHVESDLDGVLDVGDVLGEASFVALGGRALGADAVLLLLEQLERDRVCVVGLKKSELLAFESLQVGRDLRALPFGVAAGGNELVVEQPLEVVSGDLVESETLLVLLNDLVLHHVYEHRLLRADVAFCLTRGTVEVRVDLARLRPRHLHDQPVVAVPAVHRALEVVVVAPPALAGATGL